MVRRPQAWEQSTDLAQRQHGLAIVLQLTGLPKEIARKVPLHQLAEGAYLDFNDGMGQVWRSGVDLLIHGLTKKFAPLQVESAIGSMTKLVAFRRHPGEQIDRAIARFDLLRHKTVHLGQFSLGTPNLAWMLLNALNIPPNQWAQFLAPTHGNFICPTQRMSFQT